MKFENTQWTIKTTEFNPTIFKNGYEYTILQINNSNIRWKCSKVTCSGKVTMNLSIHKKYIFYRLVIFKCIIICHSMNYLQNGHIIIINHVTSNDNTLKLKNVTLIYMKSRAIDS